MIKLIEILIRTFIVRKMVKIMMKAFLQYLRTLIKS